MDGEAVRDYVEQSRSLLEASPQMDEENTKVKLIQPFLDLLGWDFYSTEVELEYTVQMGTQQSKVDYALMEVFACEMVMSVASTGSRLGEVADTAADDPEPVGALGLIRPIRDPETQAGLGALLSIGSALGKGTGRGEGWSPVPSSRCTSSGDHQSVAFHHRPETGLGASPF